MGFGLQARKILGVGMLLAAVSGQGYAAPGFVIETKVVGTLNDAALFGGCMARLSTNLEAQGMACGADPLVSFDCLGKIGTKSAGTVSFQAAQLAYVTGNKVNIYVDDTAEKKAALNGFCYSGRIDVLAPG